MGHRVRAVAAGLWEVLPPAGRVALAGVVASAAVALALGIFIPTEIRRHLLAAEARGLETAVEALAPALPDLTHGPLTPEQVEATERMVDRALLDSDHVRAKLWSLDGVVLYSNERELIGGSFADVSARLAEVVDRGVQVEVTDLRDPENVFEREYGSLIEVYVPVRNDSGQTVGVFEIYEDVRLLEDALSRINLATWLAIGSGLTVLLVFLVLLVTAAVRSISRDRAEAQARAAELAIMVGAAEALASSLEPAEFIDRLQDRVRRALGLTRLEVLPTALAEDTAFQHRLRDGSWLIASRAGEPLREEERRVLRSIANSLDIALANARLYREVRDAAETRRMLLRKVVEAHEDERRLLVGELHDSLAGELIRVLYGIRGVLTDVAQLPEEIGAELSALERLVSDAEQDLRAFMNRVRPMSLERVGLMAALQDVVARFRQETHIQAGMRVWGDPDALASEAQIVILRAGEEGLLNVRKHAGATRVRVGVRVDERRVTLTVDDDGRGWGHDDSPADGRGFGLPYLRDRIAGFGGAVHAVRSRLGGARLVVEIPRSPP